MVTVGMNEFRKSQISTDPVRNFKFIININHQISDSKFGGDQLKEGPKQNMLARMGFMNMSGLATTTEVIPYREGGNNTTQRKMPGQTTFGDVTLSQGMVLGGTQPWAWTRQLFSANAGQGNNTGGDDFRTNVDVFVLAHPVTDHLGDIPAHVKFRLYNAWITGLAFSELDAGGNAVYVQQMTLTHEGFELNIAGPDGAGIS